MARTTSAYPRDGSARTQATFPGLGTRLKRTLSKDRLATERSLQAAAGLHLLAIAAAVLGPSSPPLPLFLTVTGLLLVVLSLSRPTTKAARLAAEASDGAERIEFDLRALALERQSQRLVEIADAASRARREAEMRGQLWAELTARMSHELRTPLNAVIGFSDLMSAELFGPLGHPRYRDYSRHIRECGRDLLKCTEDTLALTSSLAKPANPSTVRALDLGDVVSEAWAFYDAETATRRIRLAPIVAPATEILAEPRPTRQILINLFAEALARTPSGGTVSVTAEDDGSVVSLAIRVAGSNPRADVGQAPLAICIARVLLEQQGSCLVEQADHEAWSATTFLDRATQQDFFACHAA